MGDGGRRVRVSELSNHAIAAERARKAAGMRLHSVSPARQGPKDEVDGRRLAGNRVDLAAELAMADIGNNQQTARDWKKY